MPLDVAALAAEEVEISIARDAEVDKGVDVYKL